MRYNVRMEKFSVAVIGGGAAGLVLATALRLDKKVVVFERLERVGKKLAATGNGQGNLTNADLRDDAYFSQNTGDRYALNTALRQYDNRSFIAYMQALGVLTVTDEKGRVYPSGRQASALCDALRFAALERGVTLRLQSQVTSVVKKNNTFLLCVKTPNGEERVEAERVVLCAGGKAAKNFGTDGSAYGLAVALGHSVTPLYPSLVQLKTDVDRIKTLKGIRVADAALTAEWTNRGKRKTHTLRGDVIFTDYGVSGDAVFRMSAFIADSLQNGVRLSIDLLPAYTADEIYAALLAKRQAFEDRPFEELLCGILNNQVARAVMKTVERDDLRAAANAVKAFPLTVKGTLGYDYAQVTKGGIPLCETDANLQSNKVKGLYFAGEILDVDGECGGYNLQWAYSSARTVAAAIDNE